MRKIPQQGDRWHGQLSASLLILSLLLPIAQLAFNSSDYAEATLPACCRAHGRHKCAMLAEARPPSPTSSSRQLAKVNEDCPYAPGVVPTAHSNSLWNPSLESARFDLIHQRIGVSLSKVQRTGSLGSTNLKRGPPTSSEIA
jgi:hypothetical protein